jgi:hypothetical protein
MLLEDLPRTDLVPAHQPAVARNVGTRNGLVSLRLTGMSQASAKVTGQLPSLPRLVLPYATNASLRPKAGHDFVRRSIHMIR